MAKKYKINKKKFKRFVTLVLFVVLAFIVLFTPVFIHLNGPKTVALSYGESYEELGAKALFGNVRIRGDVDTSIPGEYKITYSFLTERVKRTVRVEDNIRPRVTLEGPSNLYLTLGSKYSEYGYSAWDEIDGDLTDRVEVSGLPDMSKTGEYVISYIATDKAGNQARERRTVNVVEDASSIRSAAFTDDVYTFDLNKYYPDVLCKEVSFDEDKYEKLIYFGDSFIEKLGEIGLISADKYWSRPSTSTDDFYDKFLNYYDGGWNQDKNFFELMEKYEPDTVLLLLNSDWSGRWTPEYLYQSCDKAYAEITERFPETTFIICSIFPVDYFYDSEYMETSGFNRDDRINKMNAYMCELCRRYGLKFMNGAECVKNPATGACYDEYIYEPDGIHLSDEGCEKMLEYIKTHLDY